MKVYYQISPKLIVPYLYHYSHLYIDSYVMCVGMGVLFTNPE